LKKPRRQSQDRLGPHTRIRLQSRRDHYVHSVPAQVIRWRVLSHRADTARSRRRIPSAHRPRDRGRIAPQIRRRKSVYWISVPTPRVATRAVGIDYTRSRRDRKCRIRRPRRHRPRPAARKNSRSRSKHQDQPSKERFPDAGPGQPRAGKCFSGRDLHVQIQGIRIDGLSGLRNPQGLRPSG
jgi:hypothetical protein